MAKIENFNGLLKPKYDFIEKIVDDWDEEARE